MRKLGESHANILKSEIAIFNYSALQTAVTLRSRKIMFGLLQRQTPGLFDDSVSFDVTSVSKITNGTRARMQ